MNDPVIKQYLMNTGHLVIGTVNVDDADEMGFDLCNPRTIHQVRGDGGGLVNTLVPWLHPDKVTVYYQGIQAEAAVPIDMLSAYRQDISPIDLNTHKGSISTLRPHK